MDLVSPARTTSTSPGLLSFNSDDLHLESSQNGSPLFSDGPVVSTSSSPLTFENRLETALAPGAKNSDGKLDGFHTLVDTGTSSSSGGVPLSSPRLTLPARAVMISSLTPTQLRLNPSQDFITVNAVTEAQAYAAAEAIAVAHDHAEAPAQADAEAAVDALDLEEIEARVRLCVMQEAAAKLRAKQEALARAQAEARARTIDEAQARASRVEARFQALLQAKRNRVVHAAAEAAEVQAIKLAA